MTSTLGRFCSKWPHSIWPSPIVSEFADWLANWVSDGNFRVATAIGGIGPAGLPEYRLVELSTVNYQSNSNCQFHKVDHRLCAFVSFVPISKLIPLWMTTTTRGTNTTGFSRMSSSQMKHGWGLFLELNLLLVVTVSV